MLFLAQFRNFSQIELLTGKSPIYLRMKLNTAFPTGVNSFRQSTIRTLFLEDVI